MLRGSLAVVGFAALAGCARGSADDSASITPEPARRGVTAVEGSAELAPGLPTPPRPPAAPTFPTHARPTAPAAPGSRVAVAEAPTPPPTEAPAIRSIPLAITGMT